MYPCSACGLCCQNISNVKELNNFNLGNGVCKYFDIENNNCKIYENRPEICRIDLMYKKKYKRLFTQNEFYKENAKVCNFLQSKYKLDKSYIIEIGE